MLIIVVKRRQKPAPKAMSTTSFHMDLKQSLEGVRKNAKQIYTYF